MYTPGDKEGFRKELKVRIYKWTVKLTRYLRDLAKRKSEKVVWNIVDQLLRSGTSTGANYVEAIGSPSEKDFRHYLSLALKSGNESKYWLALIRDGKIDDSEELNCLLQEAIEIANILGKSISTMYKKERDNERKNDEK